MERTATGLIFERSIPLSDDRRTLREGAAHETRGPEAPPSPPPPPPDLVELDRRVQQASYAYTGYKLWAVCLFLLGGAFLAVASQVSYVLCALCITCLAAAVVVQYTGRRKLRAALVERALAKGTSEATARSEAEAALERMSR